VVLDGLISAGTVVLIQIIDYIIIGSDSGRITIVEFVPAQNKFNRLHLETFGKSGVRIGGEEQAGLRIE
jgi:hypothetical protein